MDLRINGKSEHYSRSILLYSFCCFVSVVLCGPLTNEVPSEQAVPEIQKHEISRLKQSLALEEQAISDRRSRQRSQLYTSFLTCSISMETICFIDAAEKALAFEKDELWAEADQGAIEAARALGPHNRSQHDPLPSSLAVTINQMIAELAKMFHESFGSMFTKNAREVEDEEDEEEVTALETTTSKDAGPKEGRAIKSRESSEARKKKKGKIHKLVKFIKLAIIGIILVVKISLLIKILSFGLQVKFFVVSVLALILNAVRFYLDVKQHVQQPQKVIYYEHANHQHHYEDGDEDWSSTGPGGGSWGRSYGDSQNDGQLVNWRKMMTAQDLAYAKQKPRVVNAIEDNRAY